MQWKDTSLTVVVALSNATAPRSEILVMIPGVKIGSGLEIVPAVKRAK